jgi:hypothetical protein
VITNGTLKRISMIPKTNVDLKASISTKRLRYETLPIDNINDLLPTILLLLADVFLMIQMLIRSDEGFKTLMMIGSLIALVTWLLLSTFKEYNTLDVLEEIKIKGSGSETKDYLKQIAKNLRWTVLEEAKDYIIFRNKWRITNTGEHITVIPLDNVILINSTTYSINSFTRSTLSFGKNKRNIRRFRELMQQLVG